MHFQSLREEMKKKGGFNIERIQKAYAFAEEAHAGQKRKTGEDYVTHPVAVAQKLVHLGADDESIIAALLHDTVEDTDITLETVAKEFGSDVANLVDGLTKFEKHTFEGQKELDEKIETIRKWMIALKKDLRIAIIKIADRIDNLSSLSIFRPEKRMRIAQETIDIYARVAKWLSLEEVRQELEHYSFPHILSSNQFETLEKRCEETEKTQKRIVAKIRKQIEQSNTKNLSLRLEEHMVSVQQVYFASALPFSAYCIVSSEEECYQALSLFHKNWHRKKGSFQDYINAPKINGYQAMHTTLVLEEGAEIKIKIMTEEMFEYYLRGVMTFCFDKKKEQKTLPWIKKMEQLLETNKEKSYSFWRGIQSDLLTGFIVVYGPSGVSLTLPQNSTYLDAAFGFLQEKGVFVSSIVSGGKQIPQRRQILDGARVDFVQEKTPQVDYTWLQDVDNMQSIEVIKNFLKTRKEKEKISSGKAMLQEQFDAYGMGMVDELEEKTILVACKDLEIHSLEELFIKIAEVYILPSEIVSRIHPEKTREKESGEEDKFILTCEVRKDRMAEFWNITSSFAKRTKSISYRSNASLMSIDGVYCAEYEKKEKMLRDIRRTKGMRILRVQQRLLSRWEIYILTGILTLLWGLDPVFASLLIQNTHITPDALATLRFGLVFILFGGIVFFNNILGSKAQKKSIPLLSLPLVFISVLLFGVGISSYYALQSTSPTTYLCILYPWFILASVLSGIDKKEKITPFLLFPALILFALSTSLALQDDTWSSSGKMWTIIATLFFAGYSILSEIFQKKNKIIVRYTGYQMISSGQAFLFSLMLLPLFTWPALEFYEYVFAIIFCLIFTGFPYFIFGILLKKKGVTNVAYGLLGVIFIAILGEYFFLNSTFSDQKIIPTILMILGALLLHSLQKKCLQKNLQEQR
jgi:guanosine-3',5'-bis(diphosphate) 3'-pyrophosphohydrolase